MFSNSDKPPTMEDMEYAAIDGSAFSCASTNSSIPEAESRDVVDDVREPGKVSKPRFRPEDLFFDMRGEKYLLVFNHFEYQASQFYRYKAPAKRNGTHQDVKSLRNVFGYLGFKVLVYPDFKHDQILGQISRISQQDHTRTSCLAIAILTHGDKGGKLYAADRTYDLTDLTNLLAYGHPSLVNKPKLFFIQACRGDKVDDGREVQYDGLDDSNTMTVPAHCDFFFMYSTVEDFLSWRDAGGSWMIQEVCEVLKNYNADYDLLQLMTLAIRNVAYAYTSNTPRNKLYHMKKETPEFRSSLTKLIRF